MTLWREIVQFAPDELADSFDTWKSLLHPEDRERAQNLVAAYHDGLTPLYELEHRLRAKDEQPDAVPKAENNIARWVSAS